MPSAVPSSTLPSSVPSAMPSISCFSEYDLLAEAVTEAGSNGTSGVELEGLSFIGATDVSVGALGSSNASATFDDCEWAGQSVGTSNVRIYNGDGSTYLEGNLLPFEEGSMSVEFTNCTFSDLSNLELGAIANVGGMSVIVDSVFQGIISEESSITVSENGRRRSTWYNLCGRQFFFGSEQRQLASGKCRSSDDSCFV